MTRRGLAAAVIAPGVALALWVVLGAALFLGSLVERGAALRAEGRFTIPTMMGLEKETNPFLRAKDPAIRRLLVMEGKTNEEVFAEIRRRKDNF